MTPTIVSRSTVRKANRGQVFKEMVMYEGITRADLAKRLPLTNVSINYIVAELLDKKLVVEQGKKIMGESHKNPISFNLSLECPRILGVQIQREYCQAVLCDFRLNILDSREVRYEEANLAGLKSALKETVGSLVELGNILGIGVGSIGPIDIHKGAILNPPGFGDVQNFMVADYLKTLFNLPVVLEHHYSCAALAEHYFGLGKEVNNFLYFGITKGVGMAGIVGDKLYSRQLGNVPEIGHVSLDMKGRLCSCGSRGCLERYVSTDVMVDELEKLTEQKKKFREYCQMQDDGEVMQYFYRIMDYIKVVLTGSVNLFRPDLIIIGDEGKYFPDECIRYLEEEINRNTVYRGWGHVMVKKTEMRRNLMMASPVMGIIEQVFNGELLFE